MLACWRAGVLACWRAGVLACWRAGVLACWRAGVLACWRAGVPRCRPVGAGSFDRRERKLPLPSARCGFRPCCLAGVTASCVASKLARATSSLGQAVQAAATTLGVLQRASLRRRAPRLSSYHKVLTKCWVAVLLATRRCAFPASWQAPLASSPRSSGPCRRTIALSDDALPARRQRSGASCPRVSLHGNRLRAARPLEPPPARSQGLPAPAPRSLVLELVPSPRLSCSRRDWVALPCSHPNSAVMPAIQACCLAGNEACHEGGKPTCC